MDYKFYCFSGRAQFLAVDFDRFSDHKSSYYNRKFELQDFVMAIYSSEKSLQAEKPSQYEKMLEIADSLSEGLPFLRVDLYYISNHIYVGELTICPGGGVSAYTNNGDMIMGKLLELPKK